MEGQTCAADEGAGNHQGSAAIVETCKFFQEIHSEFRKDCGVDYVTGQEGCSVVLGGGGGGERQKQDFRKEKIMLTTMIFDPKRSTELPTNTSSLDVKAMLMQKQEGGDMTVVAYFNKQITADQRTTTFTSWKRWR